MPKADFSEFSYGFAVTHQIQVVADSAGAGPPLLPSLVQEADLGFDVGIPTLSLFLQYKLSRQLTGGNAREWGHHHDDYFRYKLHHSTPSDSQHNTLVALANSLPWAFVMYAAPAFVDRTDFADAYQAGTLLERSLFLPVKSLGAIADSDQHCVTFRPDAGWYTHFRHSREILQGRTQNAEQELRGAVQAMPQRPTPLRPALGIEQLRTARRTLLHLAREKLAGEDQGIDRDTASKRSHHLDRLEREEPAERKPLIRDVAYLAHVEHDLDWLVLRARR